MIEKCTPPCRKGTHSPSRALHPRWVAAVPSWEPTKLELVASGRRSHKAKRWLPDGRPARDQSIVKLAKLLKSLVPAVGFEPTTP